MKKIQGFIAGIIATVTIFGGGLYAKTTVESIQVRYDDIKVYRDNILQELKDAQGKTIDPFVYQGTTYLPVRAAAQLAGMRVDWDGATKSIYLWDKELADNTYLLDVCIPFAGKDYRIYSGRDEVIYMGGKQYKKAIKFNGFAPKVVFNLNGEYSELELDLGNMDTEYSDRAAQVTFYLDDQPIKSFELKAFDLPMHVTIPVKNGLKLEVACENKTRVFVGLGNIIVR